MDSTPRKAEGAASSIEQLEARIAPAVFTVTNTKDDGAGSLRDAIEAANAAEGEDEIVFGKGAEGTVKLKSDLPAITDDVTISGPGAAKLVVNGKLNHLFSVVGEGLDVEISGLKLTGGQAENGGALYINNPDGTVTLTKLVITKNRAVGSTEPGPEPYSQVTVKGEGGGVAVAAGAVTIEKSKLTGNKAGTLVEIYVYGAPSPGSFFVTNGSGGGIAVSDQGTLELRKTVVSGNSAGFGGGIHNAGETSIGDRSTVSKNIAKGFYELGAYETSTHSGAQGGGIFNAIGGILEVASSKIKGNQAVGDRGDVGYFGGSAGTGGAAFGGGVFNAGGAVTIVSSEISGNKAVGGKGGTGASAGGYYYGARNRALVERGGGGEYGGTGGTGGAAAGGGIFNAAEGDVTINSSKMTGNKAIGGKGGTGGLGATGDDADGYYGVRKGGRGGQGGLGGTGGTATGGAIANEGTLTLEQTKITGNSAIGGAGGTGGKGGMGGQGADKQPAYVDYYGNRVPAQPPGAGGPGGKGGKGGLGGPGIEGGIYSDPSLLTTDNSKISGNTEKTGSTGANGAAGKQGKRGSKTGGGDPYS